LYAMGKTSPATMMYTFMIIVARDLGIVLVIVSLHNDERTDSKKYKRVPVKGVVSNAIRSKSEDNDCGDELGSSQTYEWL
jgi:hypothetical protein